MNETGWSVCPKYGRPTRATFACSSSNNEVAGSVSREKLVFAPVPSFLRALRESSGTKENEEKKKQQSKTGGASSYRIVYRWVPLWLHLRHA